MDPMPLWKWLRRRHSGEVCLQAERQAPFGVSLAFMLGRIGHNPRVGFRPEVTPALRAPNDIGPALADACRVRETHPALRGTIRGTKRSAAAYVSRPRWKSVC